MTTRSFYIPGLGEFTETGRRAYIIPGIGFVTERQQFFNAAATLAKPVASGALIHATGLSASAILARPAINATLAHGEIFTVQASLARPIAVGQLFVAATLSASATLARPTANGQISQGYYLSFGSDATSHYIPGVGMLADTRQRAYTIPGLGYIIENTAPNAITLRGPVVARASLTFVANNLRIGGGYPRNYYVAGLGVIADASPRAYNVPGLGYVIETTATQHAINLARPIASGALTLAPPINLSASATLARPTARGIINTGNIFNAQGILARPLANGRLTIPNIIVARATLGLPIASGLLEYIYLTQINTQEAGHFGLFALLNSASDHGGHIITAASRTFMYNRPVARIGDLHTCPRHGHGTTAIITGSTTVFVEGAGVAILNYSVTGCGALIISEGSAL